MTKKKNIKTEKSKQEQLKSLIKENNLEQIKKLLEGEENFLTDVSYNGTILHHLGKLTDPHLLELAVKKCSEAKILDKRDENGYGYTALMSACLNNNPTLAKLLLNYGADVKITNSGGHTVLHWSANLKDEEVLTLLVKKCKEAEILDKQNIYGQTALIFATLGKDPILVKLLVENKANIEILDEQKASVLHYLSNIEDQNVCKLIVEASKEAGILDCRNKHGFSALQTTAGSYKGNLVVKLLLEYGAKYKLTEFKENVYKFRIFIDEVEVKAEIGKLCKEHERQKINSALFDNKDEKKDLNNELKKLYSKYLPLNTKNKIIPEIIERRDDEIFIMEEEKDILITEHNKENLLMGQNSDDETDSSDN